MARKQPEAPSCPSGMTWIEGGEFWVGSDPKEHFSEDESPRFQARVAGFCLGTSEVSVARYAECVAQGSCTPAQSQRFLCNAQRPSRREHPINCVTFRQAEAFCGSSQARLPNEVEWEYAARGADHARRYPWGDAPPDGRACWKQPTTCPVNSYAADSHGVFDLSGNVWEWTDSWYAAYPFPAEFGFAKVYRGGSFSRRFEKWMHTRLRNRLSPDAWGAHLGFRCALTPSSEGSASLGPTAKPGYEVLTRSCPLGENWNGVRCAEPGAPRCRRGRVEKAGYGCVLEQPETASPRDVRAEANGVSRRRAPEFDADCRTNQPARPRAFGYQGGSHEGRNLLVHQEGCKNRDVGVGWNSACCR